MGLVSCWPVLRFSGNNAVKQPNDPTQFLLAGLLEKKATFSRLRACVYASWSHNWKHMRPSEARKQLLQNFIDSLMSSPSCAFPTGNDGALLHASMAMRCQLQCTLRFGSTAKVLAECKLKYYRISECNVLVLMGFLWVLQVHI